MIALLSLQAKLLALEERLTDAFFEADTSSIADVKEYSKNFELLHKSKRPSTSDDKPDSRQNDSTAAASGSVAGAGVAGSPGSAASASSAASAASAAAGGGASMSSRQGNSDSRQIEILEEIQKTVNEYCEIVYSESRSV